MMAPGLQLDMAQRALLQLNAMATLLARPPDVWCSSVMDLHTIASDYVGGWGCVSWVLFLSPHGAGSMNNSLEAPWADVMQRLALSLQS